MTWERDNKIPMDPGISKMAAIIIHVTSSRTLPLQCLDKRTGGIYKRKWGGVKGVNKGYPTVPRLDLSDAGHVNRFWRDKSPASTSPASFA